MLAVALRGQRGKLVLYCAPLSLASLLGLMKAGGRGWVLRWSLRRPCRSAGTRQYWQ